MSHMFFCHGWKHINIWISSTYVISHDLMVPSWTRTRNRIEPTQNQKKTALQEPRTIVLHKNGDGAMPEVQEGEISSAD